MIKKINYLKNAIPRYSSERARLYFSKENSTKVVLPGDEDILLKKSTSKGTVFFTRNYKGKDAILLFDGNSIEVLYTGIDLNFNSDIEADVINSNDVFYLFFVDGVNSDRLLVYNKTYTTAAEMNLIKDQPNIKATWQVKRGGSLKQGNYTFYARTYNDYVYSDYNRITETIVISDYIPSFEKEYVDKVINIYLSESYDQVEYALLYYPVNSNQPYVYYLGVNGNFYGLSSINGLITSLTLDDLFVKKLPYDKSKTINIFGNTIIKANTKIPWLNVSELQQKANKITVKFIVNQHDIEDKAFPTFMPNEVIELGIKYKIKNVWSPVMHIPGRKSDIFNREFIIKGNANVHRRNKVNSFSWDKELLTVVDTVTENNTIHINEVGFTEISIASDYKPFTIDIQSYNGKTTITSSIPIEGTVILESDTEAITYSVNDIMEGFTQITNVQLDLTHLDISTGYVLNLKTNVSGVGIYNLQFDYPSRQIITVGSKLPRWQVYNTAILEEDQGYLGYYEELQDYPDIKGFNGEPVYPIGKIRRHQMPDAMLVPSQINNKIQTIDLKFENIELPEGCTKYELVYYNPKTVSGHGVFYVPRLDSVGNTPVLVPADQYNQYLFSPLQGANNINSTQHLLGHVPDFSIDGYSEYQYLKPEYIISSFYNVTNFNDTEDPEYGKLRSLTELNTFVSIINANRYVVDRGALVPFNTRFIIDQYTLLNDYNQELTVLKLNHELPPLSLPYHAIYYFMSFKKFPNFFLFGNIPYTSLKQSTFTDKTAIVLGDAYISKVGFRQTLHNEFNFIEEGQDPRRDHTSTTLLMFYLPSYTNYRNLYEDYEVAVSAKGNASFEVARTFRYYQSNYDKYLQLYYNFPNRWAYPSNASLYNHKEISFGLIPREQIYKTGPRNTETLIVKYNSFVKNGLLNLDVGVGANDYKDIYNFNEPILAIRSNSQYIWAFGKNKVSVLFKNTQNLTSEDGNVRLGFGTFLQQPEESDSSYINPGIGCQDIRSICVIPGGIFWIDSIRKRAFIFRDNFEIVDSPEFNEFLRDQIFYERTIGRNGSYIDCEYDAYYERVLVSSRNFKRILNDFDYSNKESYENHSFSVAYYLGYKLYILLDSKPLFYFNQNKLYSYADYIYEHLRDDFLGNIYGKNSDLEIELSLVYDTASMIRFIALDIEVSDVILGSDRPSYSELEQIILQIYTRTGTTDIRRYLKRVPDLNLDMYTFYYSMSYYMLNLFLDVAGSDVINWDWNLLKDKIDFYYGYIKNYGISLTKSDKENPLYGRVFYIRLRFPVNEFQIISYFETYVDEVPLLIN